MQLELKHLACYLPYKLKCTNSKESYLQTGEDRTGILETLSTEDYDSCVIMGKNGYFLVHYSEVVPILRPLSDLTDEILQQFYIGRAENKIQISDYVSEDSKELTNKLTISVSYKMMGEPYTDFIISRNSIDLTDYWIVEKLLSMHFDCFNLIDKNLAIDINTLK